MPSAREGPPSGPGRPTSEEGGVHTIPFGMQHFKLALGQLGGAAASRQQPFPIALDHARRRPAPGLQDGRLESALVGVVAGEILDEYRKAIERLRETRERS